MNKQVILFPGKFDPPTIGHARAVEELVVSPHFSTLKDEVWFIPTESDRTFGKIHADVEHRSYMANLLIDYMSIPGLSVRRLEPEFGKDVGPYALAKSLIKLFPEYRFKYFIGTDTVSRIRSWRNSRKLINTIPFIVCDKPGTFLWTNASWINRKSVIRIKLKNGDKDSKAISSSTARKCIKQSYLGGSRNLFVRRYIIESVRSYITENKLYGPDRGLKDLEAREWMKKWDTYSAGLLKVETST